MSVTFKPTGLLYDIDQIDDLQNKGLLLNLSNSNATMIGNLIGLPLLTIEGTVGQLTVFQLPLLIGNIERAMLTIHMSDFEDPDYVQKRLHDFHVLASKALEAGNGIEWS